MIEQKQWEAQIQIIFRILFPVMHSATVAGMRGGLGLLEAQLGTVFDASFVNTAALALARDMTQTMAVKMTSRTRGIFLQYAGDWIESGEPLQSLIDDLTPFFGRRRAEIIASSEVTRIYASANREAWKQTGVVERIRWNTVFDDRVCPICEPLDEKTTGIDETFSGNFPPAHGECRCWITPAMEGF